MTNGQRAPSGGAIPRRRFIRLTFGGTAALALAACSQPVPSAPAAGAPTLAALSQQPTPAPTLSGQNVQVAATPTPRRLKIANSFDTANLNPAEYGYWLTSYGLAQTLMYVNLDETIRPWIASAMERNGDEGWTIKLNPAARFQNGKVIDAAAVQAAMDWYKDAGAVGSVPSLNGATYTVVDPQTLQIKTSFPDAWFPYEMANALNFPMFDAAEVGPKPTPESLTGKAFYSGMFKVRELTVEQLSLDAWPQAWDGVPRLAGVDIRFVKDAQARFSALKTGEIDMMLYVPSDLVPQIKSTQGLAYRSTSGNSRIFVILNNRRPPFNEIAVRRAMAVGIDRSQIADQVLNGVFEAPDGLFPTNAPWNVPGLLKTDVAAAKKYLDDAGWVPGPDNIRKKGDQRLAFDLWHYPQQPDSKPMAEAMQAQLKGIGMDIRLSQADDINAVLRSQNFDSALAFNSIQYAGNPMTGLSRYFLTDARDNYGGWGSADLDDLIKKLQGEFDTARRDEMLKQVQQIIARDVPMTFAVSRPWSAAVTAPYADYVPGATPDHYIVRKDTAPTS